ncbi:Berberine bridge enzyme-like 26, partial [Linum perenne]
QIPKTSFPFPHRQGNLFKIQYLVYWAQDGKEEGDRHIKCLRDLYTYMTSYVSNNPVAAYVNYKDIDIDANNRAKIW